jgi:hypothetical protein
MAKFLLKDGAEVTAVGYQFSTLTTTEAMIRENKYRVNNLVP